MTNERKELALKIGRMADEVTKMSNMLYFFDLEAIDVDGDDGLVCRQLDIAGEGLVDAYTALFKATKILDKPRAEATA
jgi:hypothetical protein